MTVVPQQCAQYIVLLLVMKAFIVSDCMVMINKYIVGAVESGVCVKQLLHSSNTTYDNTVTITWDTQTINSGSFSQSVNGDQMYRCNVVRYDANRNRYLTVKGILM